MWFLLEGAYGEAGGTEEEGNDQYYTANALYNKRLHQLAVMEYQNFLTKHPNHSKADHARLGMALSHYSLGKYREAEPLFGELARKGTAGDKNQLAVFRGVCLLELGQPAEAEKLLVAVAGAASEYQADATAALVEALFAQKKWADVATWSDTLLKGNPAAEHAKRVTYQGACARHQLGRSAEAAGILEKLTVGLKGDPLEGQAAFLLGECYRATGKAAEAAQQYAAASPFFKDAASAEVFHRLGLMQFEQKKWDEAIQAFDKAVAALPDPKSELRANARFLAGRCWMEKEKWPQAMEALREVSGGGLPSAAQATLWLGRAHLRQNQAAEAAKVLGDGVVKFRKDALAPDLHFEQGRALMDAGDFAGAAKSFDAAAGAPDWRDASEALRLCAVCLHRAKDYRNSLKSAEDFLGKYGKDKAAGEVGFLKGENLYFLNRADEAAQAFGSYLAAYPDHGNRMAAHFRLAQIYHVQKKWAESVEQGKRLGDAPPKDGEYSQLFFLAGDSLFRMQKWKEAAEYLDRFVKQHGGKGKGDKEGEPNVDTALIELGAAHLSGGQPDGASKAAGYFETMLAGHAQSPHVPVALSELGRLKYEAGDLQGARALLEKLTGGYANASQRPEAEYYLGWISLGEKKDDEAAQHFSTVVNSFAKHATAPDAALQWGLILLAKEKYGEAQGVLRRLAVAREGHPRMDLIVFSLGVTHARQKEWPAAARQFEKVAGEHAKSEVADRALYEWAWCEKELKRNAEAVKRYRQLLESYPQSELAEKVRTELAELTFDAKQYDQVVAELTGTLKALTDKKLREQTMYRLGTAYFNKGDWEQSAATFESLVKDFPQSGLRHSSRYQAGESKLRQKDTRAARDHFAAAAVKDAPAEIREPALMRLGETCGLGQQWKESEAAYRDLTAAFPQSRWTRHAAFGTGWAMEKQKKCREAMDEYRKVTAGGTRDTLAARAQFQIGECLFATKEYDAAIQELVRVGVNYRIDEWSAKAELEIGRLMEAKGDREKAVIQFRDVIQKYPKDDAAVVAKQRLDVLRQEM